MLRPVLLRGCLALQGGGVTQTKGCQRLLSSLSYSQSESLRKVLADKDLGPCVMKAKTRFSSAHFSTITTPRTSSTPDRAKAASLFLNLRQQIANSRQASTTNGNMNGDANKRTDVDHEELVQLIQDKNIQLFDVREPKEVESGSIPRAINLPLTQLKAALSADPDKFKEALQVEQPQKTDSNIVFYGLCEIKSIAALEISHKLGFKKARHYPGGWLEWSEVQKTKAHA